MSACSTSLTYFMLATIVLYHARGFCVYCSINTASLPYVSPLLPYHQQLYSRAVDQPSDSTLRYDVRIRSICVQERRRGMVEEHVSSFNTVVHAFSYLLTLATIQ